MSYFYDFCDDFLSLLFPRLCYACGNHLLRNEYLICTECYVVIPRTNYHLEKDNPVEQLFWGRCMVERAAAFSYYNKGSRIRNLIHNLKYKGIREVGYELGKIYGLTLNPSDFMKDIDMIIPVPLHPAKERIRGFNQSEIISRGIADASTLPLETKIIERMTVSATQTKRSRYERWTNVEGIFRVSNPQMIAGKHILLVDDVITTGSTIESCATELLKTDGVKVSVVALAFAAV
jgi:ComF family protein